eukprot:1137493-Pelagomonas_calceolata.AAC.1
MLKRQLEDVTHILRLWKQQYFAFMHYRWLKGHFTSQCTLAGHFIDGAELHIRGGHKESRGAFALALRCSA